MTYWRSLAKSSLSPASPMFLHRNWQRGKWRGGAKETCQQGQPEPKRQQYCNAGSVVPQHGRAQANQAMPHQS